jgi:hypothetical protein
VKAYGIPPSALTGLPVVPVNNPRRKQRTGHTTSTSVVPEPVPPRDQNQYQGDTSSGTSLVRDTSPQPALGAVPQEPKERLKKGKDISKENVRFDTTELQNEIQKESRHTITIPAEEHRRTELNPSAVSLELDPAPAFRGNERRSAPRQRKPVRLSSPPEPQYPSSAVSPDRQTPGESTGVRLRPPLDHAPLQADEEAAEVAARYQRLLTLQRELAHLKKTPSMQLLARQRIPRLEAEIKQLVATLQARA